MSRGGITEGRGPTMAIWTVSKHPQGMFNGRMDSVWQWTFETWQECYSRERVRTSLSMPGQNCMTYKVSRSTDPGMRKVVKISKNSTPEEFGNKKMRLYRSNITKNWSFRRKSIRFKAACMRNDFKIWFLGTSNAGEIRRINNDCMNSRKRVWERYNRRISKGTRVEESGAS